MKFLSFRHNEQTSYGVKVKREEAAWDLKKVFADFAEGDFHPKTLLNGLQQNQILDFQEQVRKAVVAAEDSGRGEEYKVAFADIELSIISATAVSILYPIALNVSIIEAAHGIAFAVLRLS